MSRRTVPHALAAVMAWLALGAAQAQQLTQVFYQDPAKPFHRQILVSAEAPTCLEVDHLIESALTESNVSQATSGRVLCLRFTKGTKGSLKLNTARLSYSFDYLVVEGSVLYRYVVRLLDPSGNPVAPSVGLATPVYPPAPVSPTVVPASQAPATPPTVATAVAAPASPGAATSAAATPTTQTPTALPNIPTPSTTATTSSPVPSAATPALTPPTPAPSAPAPQAKAPAVAPLTQVPPAPAATPSPAAAQPTQSAASVRPVVHNPAAPATQTAQAPAQTPSPNALRGIVPLERRTAMAPLPPCLQADFYAMPHSSGSVIIGYRLLNRCEFDIELPDQTISISMGQGAATAFLTRTSTSGVAGLLAAGTAEFGNITIPKPEEGQLSLVWKVSDTGAVRNTYNIAGSWNLVSRGN